MNPTSAAHAVIHKLSPGLINQIAAGEVVVRPASAVKELIENSLDAGATRIEIAVEEDARTFTVVDDGCGMSPADARLSVERYATSKIESFEDLARLGTRGFRGEALAAISSVSRFELLTRRPEDEAGTRLRAEGGVNPRVEPAGAPAGTTLHVRDLFFNTPARMKFLKKPVVEWGYILKEFIRQALTRPDVAFSIRWRGRPYLTLPAGRPLADRLAAVLPGDAGEGLIEVDHEIHGVRVAGAIGLPQKCRRDRRHQYYFANGRPIFARPLTFALQEAYRGLVMTQQFPVAALFLEIPGEEIDVNVHPTKEEVRFRNEPLAAGAIHRGALEALRAADLVPRFEMPREPGAKFERRALPPERRAGGGRREERRTDERERTTGFFRPESGAQPEGTATEGPPTRQGEMLDAEGQAPAQPPPDPQRAYPDQNAERDAGLIRRLLGAGAEPRVLGQIEATYILADAPGEGLLLVDQHAAHEKILYMRFMARADRREVQELLAPYTFDAGPTGAAAMEALAPALTAEGFETEPFGGTTFAVQSVPLAFDGLDLERFLRDLIDDVGGGDLRGELEGARRRIGAMAACRAAVKAGDRLSTEEMQRLLEEVLETAEALRCPHGRPTLLLLTREQLDRQFGRV